MCACKNVEGAGLGLSVLSQSGLHSLRVVWLWNVCE